MRTQLTWAMRPASLSYRSQGVCCVESWDGSRATGHGASLASEARREFGERQPDLIMGGHAGGEFVVAASEVLDECVAGGDRAQRADRLQPIHRSQPGLETSVIGFDSVVRVLLKDVSRGRGELVDHARVDRCPVGGDLDGVGPDRNARTKKARAAWASRRSQTKTSMT